jgi:hypothetical protein
MEDPIIIDIVKEYQLPATVNDVPDKQWLAQKINDLLNNDFARLVSILYRVDVNEAKLKALLQQNPHTDAGLIIADLLIERQAEKKKARDSFRSSSREIDENEEW